MNEKKEILQDEKRNLQCNLANKMYLLNLRNWPIFNLLKPDFMPQIHTVMAYCWENGAIIVTEDKVVYYFGYEDEYWRTSDTSFHPKKIEKLCGKNIKTFAHSSFCVLVLTEEGELYSCEFKTCVSDKPVIFTPTQVTALIETHIVDIACGHNHYLALSNHGKVYIWGENEYEQIGDGTKTFRRDSKPWEVKDTLQNKKVVQIACGLEFNIVLTDEVKVVCGSNHTLALTNKGEVYTWGSNKYGQLGINNKESVVCIPSWNDRIDKVFLPSTVVDIAAYANTSVAVDSNKIIYVWGDCFGRKISTPFPTQFSKIHDVFAHNSDKVMHKPITVSANEYEYIKEISNIMESLEAAFDDLSTSDFTVQVEGESIHVHKAILKIRSQYFRDKFQRDCTNEDDHSSPDSAAVYTASDEYSYIVYKAFLKYLYTGTVDVPLENALELMKLADKYHKTSLKKDCGQILKQTITASNVIFFYEEAIKCSVKELEEFCFQLALRDMNTVVLSEEYIKLDLSTRDNFIRRAAEQNAFRHTFLNKE